MDSPFFNSIVLRSFDSIFLLPQITLTTHIQTQAQSTRTFYANIGECSVDHASFDILTTFISVAL